MKAFKIYNKIIGIVGIALFLPFFSCSDDDGMKFSEAELFDFSLATLTPQSTLYGEKVGDNGIVFKITPDYNEESLKGLTPTFFISYGATVDPLPSVPRDFYDEVQYTVTAGDGTKKTWGIKWEYGGILEFGEGFGATERVWEKGIADLGFNATETSVALCGDYLASAKTGILIDKATGAQTGKKLNMTGVLGDAPNMVANDSQGNLIGCNASGNHGNVFKVYKWTSAEAAPVEILSAPSIGGAGNKLTVVGDVNGDGYIIVPIASADGTNYRWKITNGVVNVTYDVIRTGVPSNDASWRQNMYPVNTTADSPYFLADAIAGGTVFYYVKDGTRTEITGPLTAADRGSNGWGNYTHVHGYSFTFNGKVYGAAISSTWGSDYLTVVAADDLTKYAMFEALPKTTNATFGSITSEPGGDEYSMNLYTYSVRGGITCFKLKKYKI